MGVVQLSGFRTEPGRLADHLALNAEALTHLHRLGMQAMTLQALAGSDVGTSTTVINHANNAAHAAAVQKIMGDPGWQEFWGRAAGSGAATQVEASLFQDLDPGLQPVAGRPVGVLLAVQWRAKPGRLADFVGQVMKAVPHIERLGGAVRTMQSLIGTHPMTVLVSTGFADLDAYGAYSDKTATDPQWQEFWAGAMVDPTADVVRSGIYVNTSG